MRQRDEILADWRGNLPRIDRLDDLRAMGRSIRVSRDHELGATVLRRIEDVLRRSFAVEAETLRNQVAPMARGSPGSIPRLPCETRVPGCSVRQ